MLAAASWRQALQLLQAADDAHAWQLRDTERVPYLALEGVPRLPDQAAAVADPSEPVALLDYHVCYSHSYLAPIMVFRAMSMDGAALGLHALQELFPSWPRGSEQLLGFVMQQEHPLLPGPCWFSLHPCNTATVMALALGLCEDAARRTVEAGEDAAATSAAATEAAVGAGGVGGEAHAGTAERAASAPAAVPTGAVAESQGCAGVGAASAAASVRRSPDDLPSLLGTAAGAGGGAATANAAALPHDGISDPNTGPAGGASAGAEGVPDLDDLVAELAASQPATGPLRPAPGPGPVAAASRTERGEGRDQAMVGPAGVTWPGGWVPQCPGDAGSLRRYMEVWVSLVAPHVGLRPRRGLRAED